MPRRDCYHEQVKDALIREGWTITHDPYIFESDPELATDLGAERTVAAQRDDQKIAVEIKSFRHPSQVTDLERALGQYLLYEEFLKVQEPDRMLYLAIPQRAYENIFSRQVGQIAIQRFQLKLIIYLQEGELRWETP